MSLREETTTGHLLVSPFYKQLQNKYGYEVVDGYLGGIHDHFMLYKVNLDILEIERKTEKEAAIRYNFDHPKYYIVYNNKKNKYENHRDEQGTRNGQNTRSQCQSFKKLNGLEAACLIIGLNMLLQDTFIKDNESIVNEDLVAWIPIGGMHIPCPEVYPATLTIENQFTFYQQTI
ncbi:putative amine oxidase [copper-containing] [Hydractinia symbiolongicarpus]|uniref:putative amine oxidase [copper-containing] n=1 Tax=Hydractinia symbiolongicarpus TaxID=13093 RepID=UPI00254A3AAB|nr:putative amine oxidase [copper-containing] [Hydractinia symbiolongicarpus]